MATHVQEHARAGTRPVGRGDVGASLARWSLALVLVWLGAMRFTADGAESIRALIADHRLLSPLADQVSSTLVARLVGILQVGAGTLIAIGKRPGIRLRFGALLSILLAVVPLSLFFTNRVWIDAAGGFPLLGSGQGLLKYVTILGVSLYLFSESADLESHESLHRPALNVTLVGLLLALGWIGAMKFTAVEAAGIERLLETSPLMAWMLSVFSPQGASNFIGTAELVTVLLLATWWVKPELFVWGAALGLATFATTLSFLGTLPGWHPELGFPALSATGQFLIKDLILLAAVFILLVEAPTSSSRPMGSGDLAASMVEPEQRPTEPPRETSGTPSVPRPPEGPSPT